MEWSPEALQKALATTRKEISEAIGANARDKGPTPSAAASVFAREAQRILPELRKTEAMLVARIRASLQAT